MKYDIAVPAYFVSEAKAEAARRFRDAAAQHADKPLPCQTDPETWFSTRSADRLVAIAQCMTCPVRRECRDLRDTEPVDQHGIWGGRGTTAKGQPLCAMCGHGFQPRHRAQQYCGPDCRAQARREKTRLYDQARRQR